MSRFRPMRLWRGGLRMRVVALMLLAFVVVSVPAYVSFSLIVNSTVIKLGTLFAEKQILFDRYRGLSALMQEVSLAETLARAPVIRDWALDESNPTKQRLGISELEHYRQAFSDKSYFFVVGASGNYYYNDSANAYAGSQYRYTLDPEKPRDAWFYKTSALGNGCHLNVDNDENLRVTKVWINCVIREGKRVLGVLGSGVDLTSFIREVVDIPQNGVTAMFVDRSGALQAHRDPKLVDFHSLTKSFKSKKTIFGMLDRAEDRARLQAIMDEVATGGVEVRSEFMTMDGHEVLVGVGYLDRLGWYNVTVMDIDKIIDRGLFVPIGALLAAMVAASLVLIGWMFRRQVIDRVRAVEAAVRRVEAGDYAPGKVDPGSDEIGRLSQAFATMAERVGGTTAMLEARVRERTEQLQSLAYFDQLTGISNRRGFVEDFERAPRGVGPAALFLIDIDHFKAINDGFGHQAGDQVVTEMARRLGAAIGSRGFCARWGGDEFIVLLSEVDGNLRACAMALRTTLTEQPITLPDKRSVPVTVSIGVCDVVPSDAIDIVVDRADTALYLAKEKGRNREVVFTPAMAFPRPA